MMQASSSIWCNLYSLEKLDIYLVLKQSAAATALFLHLKMVRDGPPIF